MAASPAEVRDLPPSPPIPSQKKVTFKLKFDSQPK
jgi:hypothetical protein